MTTTRYATAQTPRERLIAATNAKPLLVLADALVMLCAKPKLDEAERLVRAVMIDSITERCPAADAAFTAWAYADDDTDEIKVIVAAVLAAERGGHFHAVDDGSAWSCKCAHPYATEAEAAADAGALHADAPEYVLTVVPCREALT